MVTCATTDSMSSVTLLPCSRSVRIQIGDRSGVFSRSTVLGPLPGAIGVSLMVDLVPIEGGIRFGLRGTVFSVPLRITPTTDIPLLCVPLGKDTVIGEPLFTIPFLTLPQGEPRRNLCFEVLGQPDTHFNLISDTCVSVNALYTSAVISDHPVNIISSIGIRAQDDKGNCFNIRVDLNGCSISTGIGEGMKLLNESAFSQDGVIILKELEDKVHVSVPNCGDFVPLNMSVTCERGSTVDVMRFQTTRGLNLRSTSHGLIGQFWNTNVTVESFNNTVGDNHLEQDSDRLFNITVHPERDFANLTAAAPSPRSFIGDLSPRTWDGTREQCLYAGNGQGGITAEFGRLEDSVIEGDYQDYAVSSMFETDFTYNRIQECSMQNSLD